MPSLFEDSWPRYLQKRGEKLLGSTVTYSKTYISTRVILEYVGCEYYISLKALTYGIYYYNNDY